MIEIGVLVLMRNHLYQFEGKTRIQKEGGSIGLAATGIIARIRMGRWSKKFKEMCQTNLLSLLMYKAYVDDENMVWKVMELGRRWNGKKMEWRQKWYEEDVERNEKNDVRMMREVVAMANTIERDIKLTMDVPSVNKDGKLPVLDLKMWVEEVRGEEGERYSEIVYEHYEKDMVAKRVISKHSALPEKVKRTTLAQEGLRKLRNQDQT